MWGTTTPNYPAVTCREQASKLLSITISFEARLHASSTFLTPRWWHGARTGLPALPLSTVTVSIYPLFSHRLASQRVTSRAEWTSDVLNRLRAVMVSTARTPRTQRGLIAGRSMASRYLCISPYACYFCQRLMHPTFVGHSQHTHVSRGHQSRQQPRGPAYALV